MKMDGPFHKDSYSIIEFIQDEARQRTEKEAVNSHMLIHVTFLFARPTIFLFIFVKQ